MSRIGNKPVTIPEGVELNVDGQTVKAKGKLGELELVINDEVSVKLDEVANDDKTEKVAVLEPKSNSRFAKQIWPTMRTLVNNIVIGVSEGTAKSLRLKGLVIVETCRVRHWFFLLVSLTKFVTTFLKAWT